MEYISYSEIDTDSIAIEIQKLIDEKNKLAKENNVEDIEHQITEKREERQKLQNRSEDLLTSIGEIKNELKSKNESLKRNTSAYNSFIQIKKEEELRNLIKDFKIHYGISEFLSISKLDVEREGLSQEISNNLRDENKAYGGYIKNLGDYMRNVRSPKEDIKKKYGDWTTDFSDLIESREYLSDWNNCYN